MFLRLFLKVFLTHYSSRRGAGRPHGFHLHRRGRRAESIVKKKILPVRIKAPICPRESKNSAESHHRAKKSGPRMNAGPAPTRSSAAASFLAEGRVNELPPGQIVVFRAIHPHVTITRAPRHAREEVSLALIIALRRGSDHRWRLLLIFAGIDVAVVKHPVLNVTSRFDVVPGGVNLPDLPLILVDEVLIIGKLHGRERQSRGAAAEGGGVAIARRRPKASGKNR